MATKSAKTTTAATGTNFLGWRSARRVASKHAEVIAVPTTGRIMSFRTIDGENVFHLNESLAGTVPSASAKRIHQFGGLYTWLAPQEHWIDPDTKSPNPAVLDFALDCGPYEVTKSGRSELTMVSPVSKIYGLRMEKHVTLHPKQAGFNFTVTLHNTGSQAVRWAVWNLTAVRPGGIAFFELPGGETDLQFPNPSFRAAFSRVLHVIDDRLAAVDFRKYIYAGAKLFVRVGGDYLVYRQPGSWLVRRFRADSNALYTDRQSQIELWADAGNPKVFELETTSSDMVIPPGRSVEWTETFTIVPDAEKIPDDPYRLMSKLAPILGERA